VSDGPEYPRLCGKGVLVGFDDEARLVMCAMLDDLLPLHAELVRALDLATCDEYATLSLYDDGTFELMNVWGEERSAALRAMAHLRPDLSEHVDLEAHLWDFS
jgi:hypothetical protein